MRWHQIIRKIFLNTYDVQKNNEYGLGFVANATFQGGEYDRNIIFIYKYVFNRSYFNEINSILLLLHMVFFSYFLHYFHENFTYFHNFILLVYYISTSRNKLNRNKLMTDTITIKVPE